MSEITIWVLGDRGLRERVPSQSPYVGRSPADCCFISMGAGGKRHKARWRPSQ